MLVLLLGLGMYHGQTDTALSIQQTEYPGYPESSNQLDSLHPLIQSNSEEDPLL
jgi:hypothetical protein